MGRVNCYLIETGAGYVLIDTGGSNSREALVGELESAGCGPGLLKLIVLTHGDFDHTGNAAYLRNVFGAKIAMHYDDLGMVERGDMFANRNKPNFIIRMLLPVFSGFGTSERFAPDLLVEDGDDLSGYGFDARVISIPGHSKGSIGILTAGADLFCGDLLVNTDRPDLNSLIDDLAAADASIQKLGSMRIGTVYPGHGRPFPMSLVREVGT
jgi:glyoxylase-like metal-dependent hydrolase (beta-lactamase superfamily II)